MDYEPTIIENDVPLSNSMIWERQRHFYAERGLQAWRDDGIPNYITNNPLIAEEYATIVHAFIRDCTADCDLSQHPVRIIELGAGTGRFAYLFLRSLQALLPEDRLHTIHYCMTDCSQKVITAWQNNEYLARFVKAGMLTFKQFAVGDSPTECLDSLKDPQLASHTGGPTAIIANYVLDSLPQDAFVVEDGEMFEMLVTTQTDGSVHHGVQAGTSTTYRRSKLSSARYPDPAWNTILDHYRSHLSKATLLFPSAALTMLQGFMQASGGSMLALIGDKGFVHEGDLCLQQGDPAVEWHTPECFSMMVNFDAISRYFKAVDGQAVMPQKRMARMSTCAFMKSESGKELACTTRACEEAFSSFDADDLFTLMSGLNPHLDALPLPTMMALLKLTRWDTAAFTRIAPAIAANAKNTPAAWNDVRDAVMHVWDNRFFQESSENVLAAHCGEVLLELGYHADAHAMFTTAHEALGPSYLLHYGLGLSCAGMGRVPEAVGHLQESLHLDPNFVPAREVLEKLTEKSMHKK